MAELRCENASSGCVLEPEHLIGRGQQCALRLESSYVSAQHAVIRWNGGSWELLDRGSHNGTTLNGRRVEPRTSYPLALGDVVAFGSSDERWILVEASEPQPMVVDIESGVRLGSRNGIIGLPSPDDPRCTVYRDVDGHYQLEHADEPLRLLLDGDRFTVDGHHYRFVRPAAVSDTRTTDQTSAEKVEALLFFTVSRDEEYVTLKLRSGEREVEIGARAYNYLLLTLARARLSDAALPDSARGWTYKEDLADALKVSPPQIDGEVFRIRQHFGELGLAEAATIIERRPRTRQLRIGIGIARIEQV